MDFGLISVVIWAQLKKKKKWNLVLTIISYVVVEDRGRWHQWAFTNVASSLSGCDTLIVNKNSQVVQKTGWNTNRKKIFCFLQVFFMIYPPVNHLIQRERPQRLSLSTSLYFVIAANVPTLQTLCKHILLLLRGAKLINLGLILDLHLKTMVSKKWMWMAAWWHSMMLGFPLPESEVVPCSTAAALFTASFKTTYWRFS